MATKTCPTCGTEVYDHLRYCRGCGYEFGVSDRIRATASTVPVRQGPASEWQADRILAADAPKAAPRLRGGRAVIRYETRAQIQLGKVGLVHRTDAAWISLPMGRTVWHERIDEDRLAEQATMPVLVWGAKRNALGREYWFFDGGLYSTEAILEATQVRDLIVADRLKDQARLARAATTAASNTLPTAPRRPPILPDVRAEVWQRDGGRCVSCGSDKDLEFDHIIPVSMGGANTARNIQLLCAGCNLAKGGSLV